MKAALYARVSTSESAELQNPENQLIRLREYCQFRKLDIYREYVEYASGMDDNRPVLEEMLKEARKGRFDYILVWKLDRLTRKPSMFVRILDRLKKDPKSLDYLVNVVSTEDGFDTTSPFMAGMMIILTVVASWEIDNNEKRRTVGIERAKKFGTRSGKPFGRPKTKIPQAALDDLARGDSLRAVSKRYNVPLATLSRRSKSSPPPRLNTNPIKTGESLNDLLLERGAR